LVLFVKVYRNSCEVGTNCEQTVNDLLYILNRVSTQVEFGETIKSTHILGKLGEVVVTEVKCLQVRELGKKLHGG